LSVTSPGQWGPDAACGPALLHTAWVETREERWWAARAQREAAANRHPFFPDATLDLDEVVVDDGATHLPLLLIAFTDAKDRMAIPTPEFFDAVRVPCHRVVLRRVGLPFFSHLIGSDVAAAVEWLNRLTAGRPVLFVGNSMGAFPALLLGTLCEADAVLTMNPTTSLLPGNLSKWRDHRYGYLADFDELPPEYRDIPRLWEVHRPVRTHVLYGYRDSSYRGHAEHIAEFENVELSAFYQYQPIYELVRRGDLGPVVDELLSEIAMLRLFPPAKPQ
jgi:hypothetical protein